MPIVSAQKMSVLKDSIEKKLNVEGKKINYIATTISLKLEERGNKYKVAVPTLNKIWTIKIEQNPRRSTLENLVSLIGYSSWEEYDRYLDTCVLGKELETPYRSVSIDVSKLDVGEEFTLGTPPNRYSVLKYLGSYAFEVIKSVNMHKSKGTIFHTIGFGLKDVPGCLPDIVLEDEGEGGYFDYHKEMEGETSELHDDAYYLL